MNVDLRGPRDAGQIVGSAYRLYFSHFGALFLIALISAPMQMLIAVAQRQIDDDATKQTVTTLLQIPALLIGIVATAALVYAVHEITGRATPEPGHAIDAGLSNFWPLLTTGIGTGLMAAASLLAFPFLGIYWLFNREATIDGRRAWWMLVPGALTVYLAIRWGFLAQAVVIENTRSWAARDASAGAVRGQWWRTLGVILLIGLIQLGPVMIATTSALAPPLVEATITSVVAALVLPFAITAQTLLYYDLKARKVSDASPD